MINATKIQAMPDLFYVVWPLKTSLAASFDFIIIIKLLGNEVIIKLCS